MLGDHKGNRPQEHTTGTYWGPGGTMVHHGVPTSSKCGCGILGEPHGSARGYENHWGATGQDGVPRESSGVLQNSKRAIAKDPWMPAEIWENQKRP